MPRPVAGPNLAAPGQAPRLYRRISFMSANNQQSLDEIEARLDKIIADARADEEANLTPAEWKSELGKVVSRVRAARFRLGRLQMVSLCRAGRRQGARAPTSAIAMAGRRGEEVVVNCKGSKQSKRLFRYTVSVPSTSTPPNPLTRRYFHRDIRSEIGGVFDQTLYQIGRGRI